MYFKKHLIPKCGRCRAETNGLRHGLYCQPCKNAYMREWRASHHLSDDARKKMNCRSYAHVYLKRGKIFRKPCEYCGASAEMHHSDYNQPLIITWLCRPCHLANHKVIGGIIH